MTRSSLLPLMVSLWVVVGACGGSSEKGNSQVVTAASECAGAPGLSQIGSNPDEYSHDDYLWSILCWDQGQIRPHWPSGIAKDEALSYMNRLCAARANYPPTPQEWYEAHSGPSIAVDNFTQAMQDDLDASAARGFRAC